jgi:hypothetical protein
MVRAREAELLETLAQERKVVVFEMVDHAERLELRCQRVEEALARGGRVVSTPAPDAAAAATAAEARAVQRVLERELGAGRPEVLRAAATVRLELGAAALALAGWGGVTVAGKPSSSSSSELLGKWGGRL